MHAPSQHQDTGRKQNKRENSVRIGERGNIYVHKCTEFPYAYVLNFECFIQNESRIELIIDKSLFVKATFDSSLFEAISSIQYPDGKDIVLVYRPLALTSSTFYEGTN